MMFVSEVPASFERLMTTEVPASTLQMMAVATWAR